MKILFCIESLRAGGKERRLLELIKGLLKNGDYEIHLVLTYNNIHYHLFHDINLYHLDKIPHKKELRIFRKFYRICKEVKPDIIHSWSFMNTIYAIPAAKILRIRLITSQIANAPVKVPLLKLIKEKISFYFSDQILSNSYAGLNAYKAPIRKSKCIHNGFDFERIANIEEKDRVKTEFNIPENSFIIGMVGSFEDKKDYNTFVSVAEKAIKKYNDIFFIAVGDGKNLNKIKNEIAKIPQNRLIFTGLQKRTEAIINVFDIGVLMTNNSIHGEGISNSILEYMALSKSVIASMGGGTGELVINGETGFIIKPKSKKQLFEKVEYLYHNRDLLKKYGDNGMIRIKKEFSIDKMINEFDRLYKGLNK